MPARQDTQLFNEDAETGCWLFQGSLTYSGYGQLKRGGVHIRAHRYFFEKYVEPIKDGNVIDHVCQNPQCVKPSHLRQVTNAQNTQFGRSAKLSTDDVASIRRQINEGATQSEVAKKYGLNQSSISRIKSGIRWHQ